MLLHLQIAVEAESPKYLVATVNELAVKILAGAVRGEVVREGRRGGFEVNKQALMGLSSESVFESMAPPLPPPTAPVEETPVDEAEEIPPEEDSEDAEIVEPPDSVIHTVEPPTSRKPLSPPSRRR